MINPNVLRAVGEALEAHDVQPTPGEHMADTIARALHISPAEAKQWLDALDEGCPVEEANRRAGIISHAENAPILMAVARAIGKFAGEIAG
jgi:hypothetical protein